ncbi:MAG: RHS repeat-associated core domain-containing protein [Spirochaetota bacterium]
MTAGKFTGKELDKETGLYYFGARYYDARMSRWISTDKYLEQYLPIKGNDDITMLPGNGGVYNSINLDVYSYGNENPIRYIDPDGNSTWDKIVNTFKEYLGLPIKNKPPQYIRQTDKDRIEEGRSRKSACNISSVGIISGFNPNTVDDIIRVKDGKGNFEYRQFETSLVKFLTDMGFDVENITKRGGDRILTNEELKAMREAIKDGKVILFHFKGHYAVMIGYQKNGNGENDFNYIFYDPAGDRKQGYFNNNGVNAVYSQKYLQSQMYRGDAYSVGEPMVLGTLAY